MGGYRGSYFRAFLLWFCTFCGGIVAGSGLFLLLQIRLIRYVRHQVDEISGLERFLGKMTFLWRSLDQQLYLALDGIPEEYLEHSTLVARWLLGVGFVGVAVLLPRFLKRRWARS